MILLAVFVMNAPAGFAQEYSLRDLYAEAVKNSEKIKYAEENLYIAQMGRMKAWAVLLPKVTAFGSYNRYSEAIFTVSGAVLQPISEKAIKPMASSSKNTCLSLCIWRAITVVRRPKLMTRYTYSGCCVQPIG